MAVTVSPLLTSVGPAGPAAKGAAAKYYVYLDPGDSLVHAVNNRTGATDYTGSNTGVVMGSLLAAIGAATVTISFSDDTHVFAANVTIPTNVGVAAVKGTLLSVSTGITLTINGAITAGPYQIFGGVGTVVLGPGGVIYTYAAWWGVVAGTVSDQTANTQAALNGTPTGCTCWLLDSGAGYRFDGVLNIPDHVILGCRPYDAIPQDASDTGCQLRTTYATGGAAGTPFVTLGQNSALRGVTVFYPNQVNSATPTAYPYAVGFASGKSGAACYNVCLLNAYQGIQIVNHGRFVLRGLRLDCALQGIFVDQCFDWPDVRDVECWLFWTGSTSDAWATYKQANLTALTLQRCDGWMADSFKVFIANVGINLSSSVSGSSYGKWSKTALDTVNCGILHSASADIGHDFTVLEVLAAGTAAATSAIRSTGGVAGNGGGGGIRVHGGILRGATSSSTLGVQRVVDIQSGTGNARFLFTGVTFGLLGGESSPPYVADIASASTTALVATDSTCLFQSPFGSHIDLSGIAGGSTPPLSFEGLTKGTPRVNNPNAVPILRNTLTGGL